MVERLKAEHDAEAEWRPFYLRPDTPPEGMDVPKHLSAQYAATSERLRQMARANGMEMVTPSRIPNTRLAHEATEYARQRGKGFEFHHAVFEKFYGKGQDISKWNVLRAAAEEVGLDAEEMQRMVEAGTYTAAVQSEVDRAYQIGVTGVPTYILNDRYAIVGAQPYEVFRQALERLASEAQ